MRLTKTTILSIAVAALLSACGGKKQQEPKMEIMLQAPHLDFSAEDSSAVRSLAKEYLAYFDAKDYDSAASMLHKVQNDSVVELTGAEREQFLKTMRKLPNYGTKLKGFNLYTETSNRLLYLLQVTSGGSLEDEAGIMRFYLNPVRRNGQWYLTLFDPEAEGTRRIY